MRLPCLVRCDICWGDQGSQVPEMSNEGHPRLGSGGLKGGCAANDDQEPTSPGDGDVKAALILSRQRE